MRADAILREKQLKVTKQRTDILDLLLASGVRLTAAEIHRMLLARGLRYGLATVYRTLSSLEENHVVAKCTMPDDEQSYYSVDRGHRHCLVCVRCKSEIELDGCPLELLSRDIANRHDFVVTGHAFEIFGLCKRCQAAAFSEKQEN